MRRSDKRASLVLLLGAFHYLMLGAAAGTIDVSPSGSIDQAMSLAAPGDYIHLADGTYDEAIVSKKDGEEDSPITVYGSRKAIINGDYSSKSVRITHSFITLKGFSVEGKLNDDGEEDSYINKCVYVEGSKDSPLDGFYMKELSIRNCGTECVRLKGFVVNAEIRENDIENCGIYHFDLGTESKKNGEGIYIGTASSQSSDGPDECNNNLVKKNNINTNGNECVDIKEGANDNVVETNFCQNQRDDKSGCYSCRGNGNTLRYNEGTDCEGAGIYLGGEDAADGSQYGADNSVYSNTFSDVGYGALNIVNSGQDEICDNSCEGDDCLPLTGGERFDYENTWDEKCLSS